MTTSSSTFSFTVHGLDDATAFRDRQRRPRAFSGQQLTDRYLHAGTTLTLEVEGAVDGMLSAVIGVPELDVQQAHALRNGSNRITVTGRGLLGFINKSATGSAQVTLPSSLPRVPYFLLGTTTPAQWAHDLENLDAPVACLRSERYAIVVRRASAQSYVSDPQALMEYYEQVAVFQDTVSGLQTNGRADYLADPNIILMVESDRDGSYMFASNGFTAYVGPAALQRLLTTSNGWGPWHEIGHQRQQAPWTWADGTGMTEVTVNLYAMAVSEGLYGRADHLDREYPAVKAYLAGETKDYDRLTNGSIKLAMLWQLRLTFGEGFYPQLHQRYRRMAQDDLPSNGAARKQSFIEQTSRLAQLNLTPFFDKWGVMVTEETRQALQHLPVLEAPIWDNDHEQQITLELPYPHFFGPLAYLLDSLKAFELSSTTLDFTLDPDWYSNYMFDINVDGQRVASVIGGVPNNCTVERGEAGWDVHFEGSFGNDTRVEVLARIVGSHVIFATTRREEQLYRRLLALFTDVEQTQLAPGVTQVQLDGLHAEIESVINRQRLLTLYDQAQALLLRQTIEEVAFEQGALKVVFADERFRQYAYRLSNDNQYRSELVHGAPKDSSLETSNVWVTPREPGVNQDVLIEVTVGGETYRVWARVAAEVRIETAIQTLFADLLRTRLKDDVIQADVTRVRGMLSSAGLPPGRSDHYYDYMDEVQALFFRQRTVDSIALRDGKVIVEFSNDLFRDYDYRYLKNGVESARLNKGAPSQSSLTDRTWTIDPRLLDSDFSRIEVRYGGWVYEVFESSSLIIDDSQEWMTLQER